MKFTFDPAFSKFVDGRTEFEVKESLFGDAVAKLLEVFPQLYVHLMDNDGKIARESYFIRNEDEVLHEYESIKVDVADTDIVHLCYGIPQGADNTVWKAILGVVLIIVGIVICIVTVGTACPAGAMFIAAGVGQLVGAALQYILTPDAMSPPVGATMNFLQNSVTYTFDGIKNTTASGTAESIVYGSHRVGGQVLAIYTTADEGTTVIDNGTVLSHTYLYAQIGLCEGPVEGMSDVLINNFPLEFYSAIDTYPNPDYFRVGEETQTAMPNFSRVVCTNSMGVVIKPTTDKITPTLPDYSYVPVLGIVDNANVVLGPYTLNKITEA